MKLWSDGVEVRLKHGPRGQVETIVMIEFQRVNRDYAFPAEMGMPDISSHVGCEEILDDDMHYTMTILFSNNDVFPVNRDSFPIISGSISPTLRLLLYKNTR